MTKKAASLSEEDLLSVIDLHHRFVRCNNWADLNACLKDHFLPLLDCESTAFGWRDLDLSARRMDNVNILGFVGLTKHDAELFGQLTPYSKSVNKKLLANSRSVVACDVDVPRKTAHKEWEVFFHDHPAHDRSSEIGFNRVASYMAAIDKFENGLGMGVHRLLPNDRPFTLRDVRVMELVRPILFQTIKILVLSEELARHKSLAESLADIPTGVALVRKDMRVIFLNKAFHNLIPLEPGHKLPGDIESAVKKAMERAGAGHEPPLQGTMPDQTFYQQPGGTFRLSVDLVNKSEGALCLLRLRSASDAFSQLSLRMQEGNLCVREKEICCLVRDGFSDADIAARLFISLHTVKTHMKSIHQKLDVHTRAKLVALLNKAVQGS